MPSSSPIRIAIYARVSTLLHGQDPNIQVISAREFAARRGFEVVEVYIDNGVSGTKERRPALDKLVASARQGRFTIVMVAALDRIGRSTRHLLTLLDELNHYGVNLISIRENIDFTSPMGQATLTILAAVAQLEVELTKDRIRVAIAARKLAAENAGIPWRNGRPPVVTGSTAGEAHRLRKEGASLRAIARQLGISKTSVQRALAGVPQP